MQCSSLDDAPRLPSPTNEKKRKLVGGEEEPDDDRASKRGKKDKNKYRQKTFQHGSRNFGRKNKDLGRGEYL